MHHRWYWCWIVGVYNFLVIQDIQVNNIKRKVILNAPLLVVFKDTLNNEGYLDRDNMNHDWESILLNILLMMINRYRIGFCNWLFQSCLSFRFILEGSKGWRHVFRIVLIVIGASTSYTVLDLFKFKDNSIFFFFTFASSFEL